MSITPSMRLTWATEISTSPLKVAEELMSSLLQAEPVDAALLLLSRADALDCDHLRGVEAFEAGCDKSAERV